MSGPVVGLDLGERGPAEVQALVAVVAGGLLGPGSMVARGGADMLP